VEENHLPAWEGGEDTGDNVMLHQVEAGVE
jgi:hypothetical protein